MRRSWALALATIACLAPFLGKALHVDDPLFVWVAQQIVREPLDPYGFSVNWSLTTLPMSEVTKNPPLAGYLLALTGWIGGWSELALHLGFLVPAAAVVLGTRRLAQALGAHATLAGGTVLACPVFLVSATSLMCDVPMLALWIWSVVLWHEGLERERPWRLTAAAVLAAAAALTKYFGAALLPLLALYALVRTRRIGAWVAPLLVPVALLVGYQVWTGAVYGRGLFSDAAAYALEWRAADTVSPFDNALTGLAFTGGCLLPVLCCTPLVWRRVGWTVLGVAALAAGLAVAFSDLPSDLVPSRASFGTQSGLLLAGGVGVLGLATVELWKRRDAASWLLALWVGGTFLFAGLVNWTVNARSVLPMAPAVAILLARRLGELGRRPAAATVPLALSLGLALWITVADARQAGAQRIAAARIREHVDPASARVFFQGHWGFHYYMEAIGARPFDDLDPPSRWADVVVVPSNNTRVLGVPSGLVGEKTIVEVPSGIGVSTLQPKVGAGFYSSLLGPLPFTFGRIPSEQYEIVRLKTPQP